jgi:hypothetical protein
MSCPSCVTTLRTRYADTPGLRLLVRRYPRARAVACPRCATRAADDSTITVAPPPGDNTGIAGGLPASASSATLSPGTLDLSSAAGIANALKVLVPGLNVGAGQSPVGTVDAAAQLAAAQAAQQAAAAKAAADAAAKQKRLRTIEYLVLGGLVLLAILGAVAYRHSQQPATA